MEHITESDAARALRVALWGVIAAHRPAFDQTRSYARAVTLLMGMVCAFAWHTVTQALLALGLTRQDWSAWYRLFSKGRFTEAGLAHCLVQEVLRDQPREGPFVVGVDATQIPRSSQKMPGTGWLKAPRTPTWKPGIHRAQRFVVGSWLVPREEGYSRAIPLRFLSAFPPKAVPSKEPPRKEWEAGLAYLRWVRDELDAARRGDQQVVVLGDGSYDCAELWQALPERTSLIARTARNRHLRALPEAQTGRGRPRQYGAKLPHPCDWLQVAAGWTTVSVPVRGRAQRMTYRVEGPCLRERAPGQPLYLLVVKGQTWRTGGKHPKEKYRAPSFYLISAVWQAGEWQLPLPIEDILAWVWQRWELEVANREMKSGLGVGEIQCWNARSTVLAAQWSVWVYAVLVFAGYRAWGLLGGPAAPARWWRGARRWSLNTLWRSCRAVLWGTGEFRPLWPGSLDNWLKKGLCEAALRNAVAGAARA